MTDQLHAEAGEDVPEHRVGDDGENESWGVVGEGLKCPTESEPPYGETGFPQPCEHESCHGRNRGRVAHGPYGDATYAEQSDDYKCGHRLLLVHVGRPVRRRFVR